MYSYGTAVLVLPSPAERFNLIEFTDPESSGLMVEHTLDSNTWVLVYRKAQWNSERTQDLKMILCSEIVLHLKAVAIWQHL